MSALNYAGISGDTLARIGMGLGSQKSLAAILGMSQPSRDYYDLSLINKQRAEEDERARLERVQAAILRSQQEAEQRANAAAEAQARAEEQRAATRSNLEFTQGQENARAAATREAEAGRATAKATADAAENKDKAIAGAQKWAIDNGDKVRDYLRSTVIAPVAAKLPTPFREAAMNAGYTPEEVQKYGAARRKEAGEAQSKKDAADRWMAAYQLRKDAQDFRQNQAKKKDEAAATARKYKIDSKYEDELGKILEDVRDESSDFMSPLFEQVKGLDRAKRSEVFQHEAMLRFNERRGLAREAQGPPVVVPEPAKAPVAVPAAPAETNALTQAQAASAPAGESDKLRQAEVALALASTPEEYASVEAEAQKTLPANEFVIFTELLRKKRGAR